MKYNRPDREEILKFKSKKEVKIDLLNFLYYRKIGAKNNRFLRLKVDEKEPENYVKIDTETILTDVLIKGISIKKTALENNVTYELINHMISLYIEQKALTNINE